MKKSHFICVNCGYQPSRWLGNCPKCNEWNTFEEKSHNTLIKKESDVISQKALSLNDVSKIKMERLKSDISEFDGVLGGGLVAGSFTLMSGDPGVGKTTLVSMLIGSFARASPNEKFLYISGEESLPQLSLRMERLGISTPNLLLSNEIDWSFIQEQLNYISPKFIIIDSIQTLVYSEVQSTAGSIQMVKTLTHEILTFTKKKNITCVIIGHINKGGDIAGPKILEHMVDTVLYLEGPKDSEIKILRVIKNRFYAISEVALFKMTDKGFITYDNNYSILKDYNCEGEYGTSLCCYLEGTSVLFYEIQSLVISNKKGIRQFIPNGFDKNRLLLLIAIIEKYLILPLSEYDIYLNIVGGARIHGRESDLSVICSLISSYRKRPISSNVIYIGEVSLTGEILSPVNLEKKLKSLKNINGYQIITSLKMSEFLNKKNISAKGFLNIKALYDYTY